MLRITSTIFLLAGALYGIPFSSEAFDNSESTESIFFPADNNPADYLISQEEFNEYKASWQQGIGWDSNISKIPLDSACLAGTIYYGHDGVYHVATDEDGHYLFVPGPETDHSGNHGSGYTDVTVTPVGPVPARIYIDVNPPEQTIAYAIEENVEEGWSFVDSTSGYFSESDRMLRIGPLPAETVTHEYSLLSMLGDAIVPTNFSATISYDGISEPLSTHYAEEQYGYRLSSWIDPEEVTDDYIWAFAIRGDTEADYRNLLPTFSFTNDNEGGTNLNVTLHRCLLADDIEFQLQHSNDLINWEPLPNITISNSEEVEPTIFRFVLTTKCLPQNSAGRFYRVEAKHNDIGY